MLLEQQKSKLIWHCRRGMLELDLILGRFLECHLDVMTEAEYESLETFLTYPDPDLYTWLMGYGKPTDQGSMDCVTLIQSYDTI
ncbi:MAG: succinate dehydrogenase assembly factor 2 [Legionellaceae bacterium]|nr:succinate dehydrogenase assembly factor 2 [Legionellaceae bacterium]